MRVGCITIIEPERLALAQAFVNHYRKWCASSDIHVVIQGPDDHGPMERFLVSKGIRVHHNHRPFETLASHHAVKMLTANEFHWEGWHFSVDSDEFFDPNAKVKEICKNCDRDGKKYVRGRMVDMVARNGSLPRWERGQDPFEVFPVECFITATIQKAWNMKACLLKNPHYGLHHAHDLPKRVRAREIYKLHHFKWDISVLDRMRERVRNPERFPHWASFKLFVDHYDEHGIIENFENLNRVDNG